MNITFATTAEIDRPIDRVRAALADTTIWPRLLPIVERLGRYWRAGGALYELRCDGDGERIVWEAAGAAGAGMRLRVEVALRDALINTRADIRATLSLPASLSALLRRKRIRRQIALACREAAENLSEILRPAAIDCLSPGVGDLAERYPRTIATFRAMGALDH